MTQLFANNPSSRLASAITNVATSFSLTSGGGAEFPSLSGGDTFVATILKTDGSAFEVVLVTARSGDALTVTRAQEGTTAVAFAAGDTVELRITKGWLNLVSAFLVNTALAAIAALTPASDKVPYFTSSSAAALTTLSSFGRSLIDDADAAAGRTTLGAAATSGTLAQFASTSSAQLATLLSDETGSGAAVFGTGPTLSNPIVGTQTYGDSSTKGASTAFVAAALATVVDDGNSSTADTIDFSAGNVHKSTLTGNCTYTFTAPPTGSVVVLKVVQGSGPFAVTWPGAVHWPSGAAPTLTATSGKVDVFTFLWDGTTYFAVTSGQNYTA